MPPDPEKDGTSDQPLDGIMPMLYQELRALAYQFLQRERPDHTLQPTALVHEAYLRLVDQRNQAWETRADFVGAAVLMIRRILVDHARRRLAGKRGGGISPVSLQEDLTPAKQPDDTLVALDEALVRLGELDPRKARIIELRFFGGLSEEEIAKLLDLSTRTVRRDWRVAKAWLRREIDGERTDDA